MARDADSFPHCRRDDGETRKSKQKIHNCNTDSSEEECFFTAYTISERTIQDNRKSVYKRHDCFEYTKVSILPAQQVRKSRSDSRIVITRHIEKSVQNSKRHPVDETLFAEFR